MHNGFVRVDNEKMSKSLGNFFTVREILAKYDAEVVRFFILRAHYRSPLSYTDHHIDDARQALTRLYTALKAHDAEAGPVDWNNPQAARFREAMDDDFNTPEAVAVLFELANEVNRNNTRDGAALLKSLGAMLGLLQRDSTKFLQAVPWVIRLTGIPSGEAVGMPTVKVDYTPEQIEQMIAARTQARKTKNFAESDRIRKELEGAGIVLEDKPGGKTEWRRK
jgi:cysteinyl-tRNA synthetase